MNTNEAKYKVCNMLGISIDAYHSKFFEFGCAYAEAHAGIRYADKYLQSSIYWAWYRNQWEVIELRFISQYATLTNVPVLHQLHNQAHHYISVKGYPSRLLEDVVNKRKEVSIVTTK